MPTEMELTLEQTQQGVSYEVSVSIEGLKNEKEIDEVSNQKNFQRSFRHSDTERLSRSDEVLKLKNFKKDATLKLLKSTNQERFETYVKSKDPNLWHVITGGDFQPIVKNPETKLDEVILFEKQTDDLKKKLEKNNEAKMVIYNALPRKEYERIFMCNTAKEIWKTLLITRQGNSQVKDNKIDILVQQYEQFVISEDESIDSAFARFNTIITSLKALDEGYSSKNYVRKFLRALHPKWRAKVTAIKELKDLTSLSLDELIGNLKVHEMIIKKDSEIVKAKVDRKYIVLKAKKESSDEECSTFGSEDEEYAIANDKSNRKCFRCGDPNHLIGECSKPPKDKNQRAFVGGSWSDSCEEDGEKVKNEMCLVAHASSEVCSESSDENSSIDDLALKNKYDKLCKMSLKIITKNKRLKATRNNLENELRELKDKLSTLEKNKAVNLDCAKCHILKIENEKLKEESTRLNKFEKSTHCLNEMLSNQKLSGDKLSLGFNSFEASSSGTKEIKFMKSHKKTSSDGGSVWGCDRLVSRANVIENQVMTAPVISISSDTSEESVDNLETDSESEPAEQRPVSSSHDTLAPLSEFPLAPVVAPPEIRRRLATFIRTGETIRFGRPYRTHPNGPCKLLTARKRVRPIPTRRLAWRRVSHHSSDRHSSPDSSSSSAPSDHSLSGDTPPDTTDADSSTPQRFSSLGSSFERLLDLSSPFSGPSRKRCRSPTASVPSSTHVSRSIAPTPTNLLPPRKRFRNSYSPDDSGEEHMEVDTADVEAIVDVCISEGVIAHPEDGVGMGFEIFVSDVRKNDEEFEAEASAADTREIVVDPLAIGDSFESSRGGIHDLEDTIYDI
ncbi:zf-CCHC domain-containing protein [Tanacetum coccineum]